VGNQVVVLLCCFFLILLLPVILFAITYVYRLSCTLCGLPKPAVLPAAGVVLVTWVSILIAETIMGSVVEYTCDKAGLPRWEAGVIFFFLFFPVDLVIASTIEAGLMGVKVGKGIELWFVQRLIYLSIAVAVAFVAVIVVLVRNN
jgi:hypothetical protein